MVSFPVLYFTKKLLEKDEESDYLKTQNCIKYNNKSTALLILRILRNVSVLQRFFCTRNIRTFRGIYIILYLYFSHSVHLLLFISLACPPFLNPSELVTHIMFIFDNNENILIVSSPCPTLNYTERYTLYILTVYTVQLIRNSFIFS
jgi:hypothetical protein